ncbi:sensor histidine kinase [Actinomadura kijaniata]|uniref:sensor histidine kinase n=1 Tax=Actinomadura kijaniata TaxID=46161 RepID=UPI000B31F05E|nr:sensor histidine kinase [Actinomadura kijaniata]
MRDLLTGRLDRNHLIALDAVAAGVYVLSVAPLASLHRGPLAMTAALAAGALLPLRRVRPVPVFLCVLALTLLGNVGDYRAGAAFALYPVALAQPRRVWLPTPVIGGTSVLAMCVLSVMGKENTGDRTGEVLFGLAVLGVAWTFGRAVRERRAHAGRTAREMAERAAADERLRIARELHDVVAHNMSVIAVKAGVANHVAAEHPEEVREALAVIEETSRTALTEMRHLLGVLRTAEPELAPAPGLSGLAAVADRAALAGVRVDLRVDASDLPEGVAVSAHRIVQEAITNVVKHAAPARCRVVVEAGDGVLRIDVADDGPGVRVLPSGPPGHGLIGMRERVTMYGGTFTAGPRPEGGFAVAARIPYERRS